MLRKIVSIKNVGRFLNSAAQGNPDLSRHTLIVGGNGLGKSTICAVLRSLKTGEAAHLLGRKTLGVEAPIRIELLMQEGMSRFSGDVWNTTFPGLAIFDGVFVAENVHAGEVVDIEHRRNLYRVIIGEEGVRLAETDARLSAESREKAREITAAERAIQPHLPQGMTLDHFIRLAAEPDVERLIVEQERKLEAVRQARQINDRAALNELTLLEAPEGFLKLLGRTLEEVAADAETQISKHFAAHGMEGGGGNWVAEGLQHAEESCPFCGQDIEGLPLIAAYRTVFSERYAQLRAEIDAMAERIEQRFGDRMVGTLYATREQNAVSAEFWARYCAIDPAKLLMPDETVDAMRNVAMAAKALLRRKAAAPLERVEPDEAYRTARTAWERSLAAAQSNAQAVREANTLIAAKKRETGAAHVNAAEAELVLLRAIQNRHTAAVSKLCDDYIVLGRQRDEIIRQRDHARAELNRHTAGVMQPYERRINHYLEAFNAKFSIAETTHGYPGGTAASSYRLVINNTAVDLGDDRTPLDRPSFKNTLSAGDRTTLALAFFLAHLENDPHIANKIVVFDDPFNSQDAFRRRQTVYEITKIARRCAQVIVLSHDATFLKQVWEKAPPAERVALTVADHRAQGSKIIPIDLERACQGRTATDIDDLQGFVSTGQGNQIDLIRKMRVLLESHCWTTYPASFGAGNDWLGEIVRKIREGGEDHPASALYDQLDQINDYTSRYYHGENVADLIPDDIDSVELTGYVRRTLMIVNALQA